MQYKYTCSDTGSPGGARYNYNRKVSSWWKRRQFYLPCVNVYLAQRSYYKLCHMHLRFSWSQLVSVVKWLSSVQCGKSNRGDQSACPNDSGYYDGYGSLIRVRLGHIIDSEAEMHQS